MEPIVFSRISGVFVQYADQHSYRRLMSYLYNLVNCRSSAIDTILAPRSGFDENWQFKVDDEIIDLAVKAPRISRRKTYPAPDPGVGAGLSGAPPTETGPTGLLSSRDVFLRDVLTNRARAFGCVMEDVVSGVTAFCRESTRAIGEES